LSIEIVAKAQQRSIPLDARMLFDHPTIAELVELVGARAGSPTMASIENDKSGPTSPDATPSEREHPLTSMQEGFLYDYLRNPSDSAGVVWWECHLEGRLDEERFRDAWLAVSRRHPILRTTFHWEVAGEPMQRIGGEPVDCVGFADVRAMSAEEQATEFDRCRTRPFRLNELPLLTVHVFRIADERWFVLVRHQHILLDGWSQQVLLRDVFRQYAGIPRDEGTAGQWEAYLRWLRHQSLERAVAYWRDALSDLPKRDLSGVPCAAEARSSIAREVDWAPVRRAAGRHRVTLASCIRLAWAAVVSKALAADDVVFGITTSGRGAGPFGVDAAVGLLINTIGCRVRLDPHLAIGDALRAILRDQSRSTPHEWVSLADVRRALGQGASRPFDSVLVVENVPTFGVAEVGAAGLKVLDVASGATESFPLVAVVTTDRPSRVQVKYDERLVRPDVAAKLCTDFAAAIRWIGEHPEGSMSDLRAALIRMAAG
jgi:nonribosomal peptide synthetase protein BlmV